jgi:hypothetical protein
VRPEASLCRDELTSLPVECCMTRVPRKYSDQYRLRNQELPADVDSRALTALRRAIRGIPVDAEDFRGFFTR